MDKLRPADAVILAVAHEDYVRGGWPLVTRLLKGGAGRRARRQIASSTAATKPAGIELWRL